MKAIYDMDMSCIDFNTAFLYAKLGIDEKIYIYPPAFYPTNKKYLRLVMSLYGLKQASRRWYFRIRGVLEKLGYKCSPIDECLFYRYIYNSDGTLKFGLPILVVTWVDDLLNLVAKELREDWNHDLNEIKKEFGIKEQSQVLWYLKMQVIEDRTNQFVYLSQSAYVEKMLKEHGHEEGKTRDHPYRAKSIDLYQKQMGPSDRELNHKEMKEYRHLVGQLLFLSLQTRSDICHIVSIITRHQQHTKLSHLKFAQGILKYLRGTVHYKLKFGNIDGKPDLNLVIYVDSDWATSVDDRKSTTGYIVFLNGSPLTWTSKKQSIVSLSSMEAEFYAMVEAVKEALYWKNLFTLVFNHNLNIIIYEDNTSTIDFSDHTTNHGRTKHIALKFYFIRDAIKENGIKIFHISSEFNVADMLTKHISYGLYSRHVKKALDTSIPSNKNEKLQKKN